MATLITNIQQLVNIREQSKLLRGEELAHLPSIENAASIAGMLLTTECVIADKPKEEAAAHGTPDMGGMGY